MGWVTLKSLLTVEDREYTDWYVVFLNGSFRHWWTPWLKDGFTHCYAIRWTPIGWLYLNQGVGYTEVDMIFNETTDPYKISPEASHIVRVRSWRKPALRVPQVLQAHTCVESVKSVLGIGKWTTWTPYQLYKLLKRSHSDLFTVVEMRRFGNGVYEAIKTESAERDIGIAEAAAG